MELTDFDAVQEAEQTLKSAQSRLSDLRSEKEELPGEIDRLTEELTDAQAEAQVEGRDPNEDERVQEIQGQLKELRERHREIETEIKTAEKVEAKAQDRLKNAREEAILSITDDAEEEIGEALERVLEAWENARQEVQALFDAFHRYEDVDAPRSELSDSYERLPEAHPFDKYDIRILAQLDWGTVRNEIERAIQRGE
jgi:chromosome segregation ATPase